jgi:hypothetical protein
MEIQNKIDKLEKELAKLKSECVMKYPVYKRVIDNSTTVEFTGLTEGRLLEAGEDCDIDVGESLTTWVPHTNKKVWEDVIYDKERGLFDKQLVWCWGNETIFARAVRFYDAINKCVFGYDGERNGNVYDNYEPYAEKCPEWVKEAYDKLED